MSRRRKKLDPLMQAVLTVPNWRIEVVCSCSGRAHLIGRVSSKNGNPPQFDSGFEAAAVLEGGHTTVTARCPRCSRSVPMHLDRRDVFTDWARESKSRVELSELAAKMGN